MPFEHQTTGQGVGSNLTAAIHVGSNRMIPYWRAVGFETQEQEAPLRIGRPGLR